MDAAQLIPIIVAIILAWLVIKFIVSPIFKLIGWVAIIVLTLAVLRNVFNVSFNPWLGPYAATFNVDQWLSGLSWLAEAIYLWFIQLFQYLKNWSQFSPPPAA